MVGNLLDAMATHTWAVNDTLRVYVYMSCSRKLNLDTVGTLWKERCDVGASGASNSILKKIICTAAPP